MELHTVERNGKMVVLLDDDMTIIKPVYEFLKFQKQKERSYNTLKANGTDLKIFWEFLKKNGFDYLEVSPKTITMFIDYLRSESDDFLSINKESVRTPKTINRILSTVHTFYQYLADMDCIDNPMLSHQVSKSQTMFKGLLEHTRQNNKTEQSIFKIKDNDYKVHLVTDEEMEKVLSHLDKRRDILLYKMLYLTGARIQEILDLEIESIPVPDSSKQVCVLEQIKSKGKYRDLYVPMSIIMELDDFIMEERNLIDTNHSYIFISEQKQNLGKQLTYSAAYDKLKKVQSEIGINFNFHDLRHTFNSSLAESGMDISLRKIIMGHENIYTTQIYTHLSNPYIESNLSKYWSNSSIVRGD